MIIAGGIRRLEDWYCKAGPKDPDIQWRDDYSAKEFARLWFADDQSLEMPVEIQTAIHDVASGFQPLFLFPEHKTKLDDFRGESRNHDMMIYGIDASNKPIVVCIEAKVAEKLDATIEDKLRSVATKPESNIPKRIQLMCQRLQLDMDQARPLRYQLLTGLCGTLKEMEIQHANSCLFLVVQILPSRNIEKDIAENKADVARFIHTLNTKAVSGNSEIVRIITNQPESNAYFGYVQIAKRNS